VETTDFIHFLEPWCSNIFVDNWEVAEKYISLEQPTTKIDLKQRVKKLEDEGNSKNDILIYFNYKDFMSNPKGNPQIIVNLSDILSDPDIENNSEFEYGIFRMKTNIINDISKTLIKV
jgi:hypothetical protein